MTSPGHQSGRDQGMNEVGLKPDQSPGEVSGLPPPGDKLAEMESSKKSRFSELFREAEKEENLDGPTVRRTEMFLLPLMVADERYSGEELDRFLADARKLLDS